MPILIILFSIRITVCLKLFLLTFITKTERRKTLAQLTQSTLVIGSPMPLVFLS